MGVSAGPAPSPKIKQGRPQLGMLWDLLIDASLAARDTLFGRFLRRIDRSRLIMSEQEAREEGAVAPRSTPASRGT